MRTRRALRLGAGLAAALVGAAAGGCGDESGPACPAMGDFPCTTPYELDTTGLPADVILPADNPLTVAGVALGRRLFHDPVLSADSTQSCASCHDPAHAFADPRRFSIGIHGTAGVRNAPALVNLAWSPSFFWAGRAATLEEQALEPVPNPIEMDLPWEEAVARLQAHPDYPDRFGRAFGSTEVTADRVVQAIAQFERTLVSNRSAYDRFVNEGVPLPPDAQRGLALFFSERGDCFHCHGGRLLTDHLFHDNGLDVAPADPGRFAITGNEADRGKFRTPTLRNVEHTAPYMHDGRFATLAEVIDHYSEGVQPSPNLDPVLGAHQGGPLRLTPDEKADLLAFLRSFSDPAFLADPGFGPPDD